MEDEIKKHAMLLFIGIVICAIVNIKLSSMKLNKIKKPMREKVALLCEVDANITLNNDEDEDEDELKIDHDQEKQKIKAKTANKNKKKEIQEELVQISYTNYLDDLSIKENWNDFLNTIYERLILQESIIEETKQLEFYGLKEII